jgi:hypothetical protein
MRAIEYESPQFSHVISPDMEVLYKEDKTREWTQGKRKEWLIHAFTKRPMVKELIDVWSQVKGLNGYAILEAHGNVIGGTWIFGDGQRTMPVQEWINVQDGHYAALMLVACNPDNKGTVTSQHSLILHPDRVLNFPDLVNLRGAMRIFVPGEGYMEKDYRRIRSKIDRLRTVAQA